MIEQWLIEYIGPNLCIVLAAVFLLPVTIITMMSIIKITMDKT